MPETPRPHRIEDLPRLAGATVAVRAWVTTTRSSGKIAFVMLRDGTGYVQAVVSKKGVPDAAWQACGKLTQETSVEVVGVVRADPRAPGGGGVELQASDLTILGPSDAFPITPKEHGTAFLFEHRHLWLRSRRQVAIARVRHEVVQAIRDFFYERNFVLVDTPILTGAIGEHAGTLFATEYFDLGKAYLAQTGQLYVDAALGADLPWGRDLGGDEETLLAKQFDRPVMVYNYPRGAKAFYMKENPADPRTVLNNDMLAPEGYGEIIGGSQREDDYDRLLARIREEKLPEAAYGWYLDLREDGTFGHSGFCLGGGRPLPCVRRS